MAFLAVETFSKHQDKVFELSSLTVSIETLLKIEALGYLSRLLRLGLFSVQDFLNTSRLSWHVETLSKHQDKVFELSRSRVSIETLLQIKTLEYRDCQDLPFLAVETFSTCQDKVFELSRLTVSNETLLKIETLGYLSRLSRLGFFNCRDFLPMSRQCFWIIKIDSLNKDLLGIETVKTFSTLQDLHSTSRLSWHVEKSFKIKSLDQDHVETNRDPQA